MAVAIEIGSSDYGSRSIDGRTIGDFFEDDIIVLRLWLPAI